MPLIVFSPGEKAFLITNIQIDFSLTAFLFHLQSQERIFLGFSPWESGKFPGGKMKESVSRTLRQWSSGIVTLTWFSHLTVILSK